MFKTKPAYSGLTALPRSSGRCLGVDKNGSGSQMQTRTRVSTAEKVDCTELMTKQDGVFLFISWLVICLTFRCQTLSESAGDVGASPAKE